MERLAEEKCVPCRGGEPKVTGAERAAYALQVPDWRIIERDGTERLERVFRFKNFSQALAFANRVGQIAEEQDHHPALLVEWGQTTVTWWTHKIGGLHRNDFVMAAKTDQLYTSG